MGIVDEDCEGLAFFHGLEPAGYAGDMLDAACDRVRLDAEDARGTHRAEHVLDVEAAAKPRVDRNAVDREARTAPGELEVVSVRQLERDRLLTQLAELLDKPPSVRIADVHDRGRTPSVDILFREEPPLRIEVILESAMEVEMVLAQIREDEYGKADSQEPLQRRAMRGRFHRGASVARVEHLAEKALHVDRL
jgi:hypothetical protein